MTTADIADIRKRGGEMQTLFFIAFFIAMASLIGDLIVFPVVRIVQSANAADWSGLAPDVLVRFAGALPTLVLMAGLWFAQRVFGRVAAVEMFASANAHDLGRIGAAMGWCGASVVLFAPTLKAWIDGSSTIDVEVEGWAIVLALLGGAVTLIGRMWAMAVAVKAEVDQIV